MKENAVINIPINQLKLNIKNIFLKYNCLCLNAYVNITIPTTIIMSNNINPILFGVSRSLFHKGEESVKIVLIS